MSGTTLALVLGDSHVCWLERFVSSSGIRFETGSSFVGTDCHFKLAGFRGGHVSSVRDDNAVVRLLELQMPSIVVLCLGGNDVYGSQEPVLTVGMHLYEYAQSLIARGVSHVVVCQTVRHQYSWKEGTQLVLDFNEFMKAVPTANTFVLLCYLTDYRCCEAMKLELTCTETMQSFQRTAHTNWARHQRVGGCRLVACRVHKTHDCLTVWQNLQINKENRCR